MNILKILSTLSLALALFGGAYSTTTVDLAPSDTVAAFKKKNKAKTQGFGPQTVTTVRVG